jgi:MarR family 2-MHQ and catechol resistance regulon transcriptional repressor
MPTHYQGDPADVRMLDAFIKLTRCSGSLEAGLSAPHRRHGLTPPQFGILETLWHLGPLCQQDLGRKLLTSKPNVSAILGNLERAGLVRRERSDEDRRNVLVHLSPKGRRTIEAAFPDFLEHLRGEFRALSPQELEDLGRLAKKLGRSLAERHPA